MAELRRFGSLDFLALVLVLATAGGLRVGYLMVCADQARSPGVLRVQEPSNLGPQSSPSEIEELIASVRDGSLRAKAPFAKDIERTAHVSPGYPYLVGLLARTVEADQLYPLVRWIQAALGGLTAALYFLFARRAFRHTGVGLLAGLLVALNPFAIFAVAGIDDGVLASFALAVALFSSSQTGEKGGELGSLLLGLFWAGLALVRAAFLPLSFAGVIWFLVRSRSFERGWLCGLVSVLGFVVGLGPWCVRNYQAIREPAPIVSTAYLHLWIGNNPLATGGPPTSEAWAELPADELAAIESQVGRYERLAPLVVRELQERPISTVRRRLHAFLAFYLGDRWLADGTLAARMDSEVVVADNANRNEKSDPFAVLVRERGPMFLQTWLVGMLLLGLIGWRWSYAYRWESFPATLAAFWIPVPYVLGHAEALSGPRLPLDGVLLCFTALALVGLLPLSGSLLNPESKQSQREDS